jgi:hypothetical protein
MKKIAFLCVLMIAAVWVFAGCAGVTVSTNSDAAKMAGKVAGAYVAVKHPASVSTVKTYARGLLSIAGEGKITSDQITAAVLALYELVGNDAEAKLLIVAAVNAVTVEIKTGTVNEQVVYALTGFVEGLGG